MKKEPLTAGNCAASRQLQTFRRCYWLFCTLIHLIVAFLCE